MKLVDLTHLIHNNTPVYPGTEPPVLSVAKTIARDGFKETLLHFYSHTGTHIDSPAHLFENGISVDNLPVETFFGKGIVIDCCSYDKVIDLKHIEPFEKQISESDFVLFHCGWDKYWGKQEYFDKFPVLSKQAADFITRFELKGIGVDAISVDPTDNEHLENHRKFLSNNMIIVENLTNLEKLINYVFYFCCFPLKLIEGDGSPVRAVAWF